MRKLSEEHLLGFTQGVVRYYFKRHPGYDVAFNAQVLASNVNILSGERITTTAQMEYLLRKYYDAPQPLQVYQTPVFIEGTYVKKPHFRKVSKHGYPYVFRFCDMFTIEQMQDYLHCDLYDTLVSLNIPI